MAEARAEAGKEEEMGKYEAVVGGDCFTDYGLFNLGCFETLEAAEKAIEGELCSPSWAYVICAYVKLGGLVVRSWRI